MKAVIWKLCNLLNCFTTLNSENPSKLSKERQSLKEEPIYTMIIVYEESMGL